MKNIKQNSKGITLVVLVITIIVLLVLATISIQALTQTGLFESANKAKLENKRGQISETLELKKILEQTNNPMGTAEEIITATRNNVIQNKNELEKIGKDVNVEDISTEEDGEKVDVYFYVVVDKDVYKVDMSGSKFIGKLGKLLPVIKIKSITNTTNSITIEVKTSRNEGGKIEYYIKAEDEDKYELKETKTDDSEYTYGDLIQGKKYNIKVIARAENGQTAEVTAEQTTGSITNLTAGDIIFTYTVDGKVIDKNTWTNGKVKVSAKINPEIDITGLKIQTSKDGKNYEDTDTQTFTENGTMYVILTDRKNYGCSAGGAVTNIDKTKPTIGNVQGSNTTSNIGTILVSNIEDEGGSGINAYYISMNNTKPTIISENWKSLSGDSFAYNVTSNGTYYIWVKDLAGNISENKNCTISGIVAKVDITNCDGTTIVAGNSGKVTVSYTGTPKSITYTSLNNEIATVNSNTGEVKGIATGTAKIKVELINYDGTSISGTCDVIVQTAVASIENTYYASLGDAINSTSSAATAVNLLIDRCEAIVISEEKNIILNLNGKTLYQDVGKPTITNYGFLKLIGNGNINTSNSPSFGIHNKGTLVNDDANIIGNSPYSQWVVYNEKGTFSMFGGKIQDDANGMGTALGNTGKFYMTGGCIVSGEYGIVNRRGGSSEIQGKNTLIKATGIREVILNDTDSSFIICKDITIVGNIGADGINSDGTNRVSLLNCIVYGSMAANSIIEVITTSDGYDIYLYDNYFQYTKVQFPTWTNKEGQDDIIWYNGSKTVRNDINVWYCHIKKSEHNNENGNYITHIYVTNENNSNYYGGFGIELE